LVVLGLSKASPKEQRDAAKNMGINYLLFLWEQEKLPKLLQVINAYPTTLLIDRNGKIREVVFGILFGEQKEAFEGKLQALLKEKPNSGRKRAKLKANKPPLAIQGACCSKVEVSKNGGEFCAVSC